MFMLNGQPLAVDVPFTVGEGDEAIQYPANWLRLSTAEEKAAIGITEVEDAVRADDRFFWDGDANNPKDVNDVKKVLTSQMKATAFSLLAPTDYKLIRKAETGEDVDAETVAKRAAIRAACAANIAAIDAATTTAELAAWAPTWPQDNAM